MHCNAVDADLLRTIAIRAKMAQFYRCLYWLGLLRFLVDFGLAELPKFEIIGLIVNGDSVLDTGQITSTFFILGEVSLALLQQFLSLGRRHVLPYFDSVCPVLLLDDIAEALASLISVLLRVERVLRDTAYVGSHLRVHGPVHIRIINQILT